MNYIQINLNLGSCNGYWTRENAIEALKWTIEVKLKLSDEELIDVYSFEWVKQMVLRTPLVHFWNKNAKHFISISL